MESWRILHYTDMLYNFFEPRPGIYTMLQVCIRIYEQLCRNMVLQTFKRVKRETR
jgi:hypothetical protein